MTEKFNPWEKFEPWLHPKEARDEGEGISNRRINQDAFKTPKDFPGVTPAHFNAHILPELVVLGHLKEQFRHTDPVKFQKCVEAIKNFKTQRPDWDDFV